MVVCTRDNSKFPLYPAIDLDAYPQWWLHFGGSSSDMTVCLVFFPTHWQQVQRLNLLTWSFWAPLPGTPPQNVISLSVLLIDSKKTFFGGERLSCFFVIQMVSSELENKEEDYLTLSTLSDEGLTLTAANPKYRSFLTELLNEGIHTRMTLQRTLILNLPRDLVLTPPLLSMYRVVLVLTPPPLLQKVPLPLTRHVQMTSQKVSYHQQKSWGRMMTVNPLHPAYDSVIAGSEEDLYHFTPLKVVKDYLERHFCCSLTKRERKAMLKADLKPDTTVTCSPETDEFLKMFWKEKLNLKDEEMRSVQTALLNATGPLCGLWSQIQQQGLDKEAHQVSVVLETIQRTLVFLGNTNHLLSEKRWLGVLSSIDSKLTKYAKGGFSEAGKHLFGSKFVNEIVTHVEADTAICKTSAIANKATRPSSKGKGPMPSKLDFYCWGRIRPVDMALALARTSSIHATDQPHTEDEKEANTVTSQQAKSTADWDQARTRTIQTSQKGSKFPPISCTYIYSRKHKKALF